MHRGPLFLFLSLLFFWQGVKPLIEHNALLSQDTHFLKSWMGWVEDQILFVGCDNRRYQQTQCRIGDDPCIAYTFARRPRRKFVPPPRQFSRVDGSQRVCGDFQCESPACARVGVWRMYA